MQMVRNGRLTAPERELLVLLASIVLEDEEARGAEYGGTRHLDALKRALAQVRSEAPQE
jgi:hypothetical protein